MRFILYYKLTIKAVCITVVLDLEGYYEDLSVVYVNTVVYRSEKRFIK